MVSIRRDKHAVPHISAENSHDAFLALGYVHAQDRLWQMELQRRFAAGRLSEIFGTSTITDDRLLRLLGLYRAAQLAWERQSEAARAPIEAYVKGINAFISRQPRYRLSPEFTLFRVRPEVWSCSDVIAWLKVMALESSGNYEAEILRYDIEQQYGKQYADLLLPANDPSDLSILGSTKLLFKSGVQPSQATSSGTSSEGTYHSSKQNHPWRLAFLEARQRISKKLIFAGSGLSGFGSNSWVVDGSRSSTGKPLLANDPHLGPRIPSTWYLAHLSAPDLDVIGATIPGLPGVVVGRNRAISWGITNMFPDTQDLYFEELDDTGTKARYKEEWEPVQRIKETIKVRGAKDVEQLVRITRHGPLISDYSNLVGPGLAADTRPPYREGWSLRWSALEPEDESIQSFLKVNQARNWTEFTQALRSYVAPAQNFIYADSEGNIGYYGVGRIPVRLQHDGLKPVDGRSGTNEWQGWIPFEQLPHTYNPPEHAIVTANNRPFAGDDVYIGRDWDKPYRAKRLMQLLEQNPTLTPAMCRELQADTHSLCAEEILPRLLTALQPQDKSSLQAVQLLKNWDYNARGSSSAAALFEVWLQQIFQGLMQTTLSPRLARIYDSHVEIYGFRFLISCLTQQPAEIASIISPEALQTILQQALHKSIVYLQKHLGLRSENWRWDRLHTIQFDHQPLSDLPLPGRYISRRVSSGGDHSTVNIGSFSMQQTSLKQHAVATYRQVIDLSSSHTNYFILAIGQAGHMLSPHYDDYLEDWQHNRLYQISLDRDISIKEKNSKLTLYPPSTPPLALTVEESS